MPPTKPREPACTLTRLGLNLHNAAFRKFFKYFCVGIVFTGLNIALLKILVDALDFSYIGACLVSFFFLNALSYYVNKIHSFEQGYIWENRKALRYYIVMGLSLLVNLSAMWVLVEIFSFQYLMASFMISLALAFVNFICHLLYTFS